MRPSRVVLTGETAAWAAAVASVRAALVTLSTVGAASTLEETAETVDDRESMRLLICVSADCTSFLVA